MDRNHSWEQSDEKFFRAVLDKPVIGRKKAQRASRTSLAVELVSGKRVARTEPAYKELDDEDQPSLSKTKKQRQNNQKAQKKISDKVAAASNEGVAGGPEIGDLYPSSREETVPIKAAHNDKVDQKPLLACEPQMAPRQRSRSQKKTRARHSVSHKWLHIAVVTVKEIRARHSLHILLEKFVESRLWPRRQKLLLYNSTVQAAEEHAETSRGQVLLVVDCPSNGCVCKDREKISIEFREITER